MQDGTKIRALASSQSFQQEESIREHLERAWQRVKEMGDPRDQEATPKTRTARQRAREEQQRRLEKALEEVQKLGQQKSNSAKKAYKVSISDPEARFMKQSDGGLAITCRFLRTRRKESSWELRLRARPATARNCFPRWSVSKNG